MGKDRFGEALREPSAAGESGEQLRETLGAACPACSRNDATQDVGHATAAAAAAVIGVADEGQSVVLYRHL